MKRMKKLLLVLCSAVFVTVFSAGDIAGLCGE